MINLPPEGWGALWLSLRVAGLSTLLSLPVALGVAVLLARGRFWGRGILNGLVHLPLVLPPVVTGYLLLIAFGRTAPIGVFLEETFGLVLAFRWTGAVLAAAVMSFPLTVRAIWLALEAVEPGLEEAAATLGASPAFVFATVTLPLIAPGVLAGAVIGFAKAMGEFGATITFVSNIPGETQTVPSAIYSFLQVPGGEATVWGLVALAVGVALGALLLAELLSRRVAARIAGRA